MPDAEDQRSPEERLADARRRLYMPGATEGDRSAVTRLETELGEVDVPAGSAQPSSIAAAEPPPAPARRARRPLVIGLGALGLAVVVVAAMQAVMQSRAVQRAEPPAAAAAEITLRQLLTRFSSSLPSEWQGAAIVTARERVTTAVSLPVSTSASAMHHFVVVRCPDDDDRWTVRRQTEGRQKEGRWTSVSGRCGALGFAPLPVGVDAVRVQVGGGRPFAVAVLAHR
jgi:hypothetical protein